jgi:hypothetical protein
MRDSAATVLPLVKEALPCGVVKQHHGHDAYREVIRRASIFQAGRSPKRERAPEDRGLIIIAVPVHILSGRRRAAPLIATLLVERISSVAYVSHPTLSLSPSNRCGSRPTSGSCGGTHYRNLDLAVVAGCTHPGRTGHNCPVEEQWLVWVVVEQATAGKEGGRAGARPTVARTCSG